MFEDVSIRDVYWCTHRGFMTMRCINLHFTCLAPVFKKKFPAGFCTTAAKRGLRPRDCPGGGWPLTFHLTARLYTHLIITSAWKTIQKPPLAKAQTALGKTKKIKYGVERFSIWRMEFFYPAICGTWLWDDMPLNSPKRPPYWNSTSGFDFDRVTEVDMSFCISLRNFIQIGPPGQKNDVMSIFKIADLQ